MNWRLFFIVSLSALSAFSQPIPPACGKSCECSTPLASGTAGQTCVIGTSQYLCHTTGACSVAGDWTLIGPSAGGGISACATNPPTAGAAGSFCSTSTGLYQCQNGVSACTTAGQFVLTGPGPFTRSSGGVISPTVATDSLSIPSTLLGTTPTDALTLQNTTPAANGAQQWSPCFEQIGQGWATGTGLSTPVGFRSCVVPVQGATTGASYWGLFYHPPSGGDTNVLSVSPTGQIAQPAGSSSAPSFSFAAYLNAGMYMNGAALNFASPGNGAELQFSNSSVSVRGDHTLGFRPGANDSATAPDTAISRIAAGVLGLPVTRIPLAPTATPNYATLSIGSGAWDGATTGKFVGSANGTQIGVNAAAGSTADLMNLQVAGVSEFNVTAAGIMTLGGSTFVLGGHTCSIVATVLTCP
jgi:hypothetical protein